MKKFIILIGVLLSIILQVQAEKSKVFIDIYRKGQVEKSTTVRRTPVVLPSIYVYYDNNTRQLEFSCEEDIAAEIVLYDSNKNVLSYSSSLKTTFEIAYEYKGTIIIHIDSEDWYATGKLEVL